MDPRSSSPLSLSHIARLTDNAPDTQDDNLEVIVLDCSRSAGELDDLVSFTEKGVWIRHTPSIPSETRVVLHLQLPDVESPLVLKGMVVGHRPQHATDESRMLIWFDTLWGENVLLLQQYLEHHIG